MFGFLAGIASFIGGAVSAIGSFFGGVGTVLGTVGTAITAFAKTLVTGISGSIIGGLFNIIGSIINPIAKGLGIGGQEQPEELGAKARDAEMKPADFQSTQDYIRYLQDEVALDRSRLESMSPEESLACKAVGIGILSQGISEKKGIEIPPEFWIESGRQKLESKQAEAFIDQFKLERQDLGDFGPYLKGELRSGEALSLAPTIERALQQQNPGMSQDDIASRIATMKETARKVEP
jgi:hypothetical protein